MRRLSGVATLGEEVRQGSDCGAILCVGGEGDRRWRDSTLFHFTRGFLGLLNA